MYILKQRKCRLKDLLVSFTPPFQEKVASLDIKNTLQTKPRCELHSHAKNCCLQNASKKFHFVVWYFQVPYATYVACISANHLHEYKYVFTTSLIIGGVWFLTNILLSKSAVMSTNLFSWVYAGECAKASVRVPYLTASSLQCEYIMHYSESILVSLSLWNPEVV